MSKQTVMTICGTRPELIRLSRIIPKLDKLCNHILVHTGQNYDRNLNEIFFEELGIRQPDYYMNAKGTLGEQISIIMKETEKVLDQYKPDKVLILGDTNSGLSAYIAKRKGIKIYHCEAGNRCHDQRVPEETNRKMIDNLATYNFPYTPGSRENLLREGFDSTKVIVSGNPIYEVIRYYNKQIDNSKILEKLKLSPHKYFLATFHRQETVDDYDRLFEVLMGLVEIEKKYKMPVVCSVHPRTREKLNKTVWRIHRENLTLLEPIGFFDFVKLEKYAKCILSDSGTVCEEACILRVPHVIMRDSTERPETVRVGASIISKVNADNICKAVSLFQTVDWEMPEGYIDNDVSNKMISYLLGEM
jgi:UDP-N-acetylglucosamine 2-epimerase (non-hydrolysing)